MTKPCSDDEYFANNYWHRLDNSPFARELQKMDKILKEL